MHILKHHIVILLAFSSLTGCATLPEQPGAQNRPMSWQDRAATLAKIQAWDIKAVMAVQTHAGTEGGSANLQWQQRYQNFTLLLFGPLGAGSMKIAGRPGYVLLETADGQTFSASSTEILLAQQTGWQLPVSDLYYWIRGLPVPGVPANKQFDAYHHLVKLNQQGWTIDFLRYSVVHQVDVPTKISLENWRIKVKMVIRQWDWH